PAPAHAASPNRPLRSPAPRSRYATPRPRGRRRSAAGAEARDPQPRLRLRVSRRSADADQSAVVRILDDIAQVALAWLPLVLAGLIIYLLWRMVQLMPRVKPAQIEPGSKSSVKWTDVAGLEEVKEELQE